MTSGRSRAYDGFTRPVEHELFAQLALHWALANVMNENALTFSEMPFNLRAGGQSNWFIETKNVIMHPYFDPLIASMMGAHMSIHGREPKGIIGMGIGGMALARSISWVFDIAVSEASNASEDDRYPRGIYGRPADGVAFTLVDDALSTGSSIDETVELIHEEGGTVEQIGVVTDRSNGQALDRLRKAYQVPAWSLFTFDEARGLIVPSGLS